MIVKVMGTAPLRSIAKTASTGLELSVAARSKVCVLNMLQYDSDSISYFLIVLTPLSGSFSLSGNKSNMKK